MTSAPAQATAPTSASDKAVMFSDLVASTEHLEAVGSDIWIGQLDRHTRSVSAVSKRSHGTVATFLGDGFMVLFDEPGRAVEAALRLQYASRVLDVPGVRVGIDHGPMKPYRSTWWVGRPAHVAARLTDWCAAGDILVSDSCWRVAATATSLPTDDERTLHLRGLCEPTLAHAIRPAVPA